MCNCAAHRFKISDHLGVDGSYEHKHSSCVSWCHDTCFTLCLERRPRDGGGVRRENKGTISTGKVHRRRGEMKTGEKRHSRPRCLMQWTVMTLFFSSFPPCMQPSSVRPHHSNTKFIHHIRQIPKTFSFSPTYSCPCWAGPTSLWTTPIARNQEAARKTIWNLCWDFALEMKDN